MKFTVEIQCDNAVFKDDPVSEIVRILGRIRAMRAGDDDYPLLDTNGNRVGVAKFEDNYVSDSLHDPV